MVNRSRPFGENEWNSGEADTRFRGPTKSHNKRDLDESCPECGSDEFAHWNSIKARLADYDWCSECNYGRSYMPTG